MRLLPMEDRSAWWRLFYELGRIQTLPTTRDTHHAILRKQLMCLNCCWRLVGTFGRRTTLERRHFNIANYGSVWNIFVPFTRRGHHIECCPGGHHQRFLCTLRARRPFVTSSSRCCCVC